jgi:hypothetical protein
MSNLSIDVPGFVRAAPVPGCPDPAFLPQIQPSHLTSLQIAPADAIKAPPPTPGPLYPGNLMRLLVAS